MFTLFILFFNSVVFGRLLSKTMGKSYLCSNDHKLHEMGRNGSVKKEDE